MAWATASSVKTWFHSLGIRSVVITVGFFRSWRSEMTWKSRWLFGWRRAT
jgi:hypothetical protein